VLVSESGGGLPKHVALKFVYISYIITICENYWFFNKEQDILTFKISTSYPLRKFLFFFRISEQTGIFSYTPPTDCFLEVQLRRREFAEWHCVFKDRIATLAASHRPLNPEAPAQSRVIASKFRGGQSGSAAGFNTRLSGFPCQYNFTNAPHASSSTYWSCQKNKWTKCGNLHT
jgi:hypothetical protein